VHVANDVHTH